MARSVDHRGGNGGHSGGCCVGVEVKKMDLEGFGKKGLIMEFIAFHEYGGSRNWGSALAL